MVGWVQSGAPQRRMAECGGWLARLRGEGKERWDVEELSWEGSEEAAMAGNGLRRALVG